MRHVLTENLDVEPVTSSLKERRQQCAGAVVPQVVNPGTGAMHPQAKERRGWPQTPEAEKQGMILF